MYSVFSRLAFLFIICFSFSPLGAQNDSWRKKISGTVKAGIDRNESSNVLVIFSKTPDLSFAHKLKGKSEKSHFVAALLQKDAAESQRNANNILRKAGAAANSLWLVNAIAISKASPALINELAALPEVKTITDDPQIRNPLPQTEQNTSVTDRGSIEWGVLRVHAPEVWAKGFTGQGVTIGGADTGYEWNHPSLKPHYRGYFASTDTVDHNYNWHDAVHGPIPADGAASNPCGFDSPIPCDDDSHGTHTMGIAVGDDGQGNQIGIAPGAKWIGCRNMEEGWGQPSSYIECFQWFLAPTDLNGQNPDPSKAPHVINNSWGCTPWEGCTDGAVDTLIINAIIALRAAGVVVVVSNGNEGPTCNSTIYPPTYFKESFSVGSTRINDNISSFSSRGPVIKFGEQWIKPDISAPGQNILSAIPGGGYGNKSGTSMASPNVVGVIALLLSAVPELEGEVALIEEILKKSATPKFDTVDCNGISGLAHPNHAFGYGIVDALAAIDTAQKVLSIQTPLDQSAVFVYPNPTTGTLWFVPTQSGGSDSLFEIFNLNGKLVFQTMLSGNSVDASPLPSGIYAWRLRQGSKFWRGKITKF